MIALLVFLQSLPAAPQPTALSWAQVAAMLGGAVALSTIIVGAFRLGAISNRMDTMESGVSVQIIQLTERFVAVEKFIEQTRDVRNEWHGWRSQIEQRADASDSDRVNLREDIHDLRTHVQTHGIALAVIEERRSGLDRRATG